MINRSFNTNYHSLTLVEVFKTDVQKASTAAYIIQRLLKHFPHNLFNFDLDDCDKILRVEGNRINAESIAGVVRSLGVSCCVLEE